jgi:hypothetical protein
MAELSLTDVRETGPLGCVVLDHVTYECPPPTDDGAVALQCSTSAIGGLPSSHAHDGLAAQGSLIQLAGMSGDTAGERQSVPEV